MPYGVTNRTGIPSSREVARIVHRAIDHGVTHIDTGRVYGESEERLGEALSGSWRRRVNVVTKLAPVVKADGAAIRVSVDASVHASCRALRTERLDILLLHRAANRFVCGGAAWERLKELKRTGTIGLLGVSVQNPDEAEDALSDSDVDLIQLPFNLLDYRWTVPLARPKLIVHARSVLLQGLLTGASAGLWPRIEGFDFGALATVLNRLVEDLGCRSVADLAIAFVRAHAWIHSLVIGMETEAQLNENLMSFSAPALDERALAAVRRCLPKPPLMLLDPARWSP
jgi:aryl-alcohol dehydrogenase-like predicted oxidoreductase